LPDFVPLRGFFFFDFLLDGGSSGSPADIAGGTRSGLAADAVPTDGNAMIAASSHVNLR
jgi:hypothetical protein